MKLLDRYMWLIGPYWRRALVYSALYGALLAAVRYSGLTPRLFGADNGEFLLYLALTSALWGAAMAAINPGKRVS
jgi:hypothetical protein